jgi:hypothetical protein
MCGQFLKRITLILLALLFGACKPQEKEQVIDNKVVRPQESVITGQLFIVTKNRANIVLGDEKIALLDEDETRKYLNPKFIEWSNSLAEAQFRVDVATKNFDSLYQKDLKTFLSSKKYHDNRIATYSTESSEWQESLDWSVKLREKINALAKLKYSSPEGQELDTALDAQDALWEKINWPSPDYFSPQIAVATTDSEGRFKFVVPASHKKLILLAKSSRLVGEDREDYWWAVPFSSNGKTTEVILSNDNKDSGGLSDFSDGTMEKYFMHYGFTVRDVKFRKSLYKGYKESREQEWEQQNSL